ncbi:MAG: flagellar biosynthetic protein FliR [Fusobacteria bacterium]|nr:flagellar biosynthetic protein FliR [Fusobacteriota bacterium]
MSFGYVESLAFLFIFLRISGIFIITPFFSNNAINTKLKLGITFLLSYILFPIVPKNMVIIKNLSVYSFFYLSIKEILIGLIIGFFILMVFTAFESAAQIYSMDMGFGMLSVFDPLSQVQMPVLGQVNYIFLILVFFNLGIHRLIILTIANTFYKFQIGDLNYNIEGITKYISVNFVYYFTLSLKIALPIAGILFLTNVILGVMARIAPQMNVFFIGMPLKILLGFFILFSLVPYFFNLIKIILDDGMEKVYKLISIMFI